MTCRQQYAADVIRHGSEIQIADWYLYPCSLDGFPEIDSHIPIRHFLAMQAVPRGQPDVFGQSNFGIEQRGALSRACPDCVLQRQDVPAGALQHHLLQQA